MKKLISFIFPIVMIAFGVIAIVSGAHKLQTKNSYDGSVTAVITGIDREWAGTDSDGFDEYDYHVYIEYEINGKKFENVEYPGYSSSMKKGDTVEILYDSTFRTHFGKEHHRQRSVIHHHWRGSDPCRHLHGHKDLL